MVACARLGLGAQVQLGAVAGVAAEAQPALDFSLLGRAARMAGEPSQTDLQPCT